MKKTEMKKFYFYDHHNNECELIVGNAREIKSLYKKMCKNKMYIPLFTEKQKYNKNDIYGIVNNGLYFWIVTNNNIVGIMSDYMLCDNY